MKVVQAHKIGQLFIYDDLGYDIRTRDGNAYMARYIFDHYGSVPWQSSAKCWSRAN